MSSTEGKSSSSSQSSSAGSGGGEGSRGGPLASVRLPLAIGIAVLVVAVVILQGGLYSDLLIRKTPSMPTKVEEMSERQYLPAPVFQTAEGELVPIAEWVSAPSGPADRTPPVFQRERYRHRVAAVSAETALRLTVPLMAPIGFERAVTQEEGALMGLDGYRSLEALRAFFDDAGTLPPLPPAGLYQVDIYEEALAAGHQSPRFLLNAIAYHGRDYSYDSSYVPAVAQGDSDWFITTRQHGEGTAVPRSQFAFDRVFKRVTDLLFGSSDGIEVLTTPFFRPDRPGRYGQTVGSREFPVIPRPGQEWENEELVLSFADVQVGNAIIPQGLEARLPRSPKIRRRSAWSSQVRIT